MTGDTGSALRAAVLAAPADDAPWLVYADWLQEGGRDGEAAAVRAHLPAVRAAVAGGADLALVLELAARHPPGSPVWEAAYGPRLAPPVPAPAPARRPVPTRESWSAGARDDRGGRPGLILLPILYLCFVGLRGLVPMADRARPDPVRSPDPVRLPATWAPGPAVPTPSGARAWDPAEVAGYTFMSADGGARWFAFGADGTVTSGNGSSLVRPDQWWRVDAAGGLELTDWTGTRTTRLVKFLVDGQRYQVERDGRPEVYFRGRP